MAKSRSFSEKHRIAREWAEAGFYVFPCLPNAKAPLHMGGYKSATTDLAQIDAWWQDCPEANIGCAPAASGHFVIDIDDKGDKHGSATLRRLVQENSELPETFTVTTPSGGRHLWFNGSAKSTVENLGPGLDTRGVGGYVLLPGSGVDGREYDTERSCDIVEAPNWIYISLNSRRNSREDAIVGTTDEPRNIRRATKYLEDLVGRGVVAISGAGGNALTYETAAMLHDIGVSEDVAIELILEHWNDHCDPPWTEEELTDEIHSPVLHAFSYAQNSPGSKSLGGNTASDFAGIQGADKPEGTDGHGDERSRREDGPGEFYPRDETEQDSRPEPTWLIPGWFQMASTVLLYGPPNSFKSFAALDIALAVAAGKSPLGLDRSNPGPSTKHTQTDERSNEEVGRRRLDRESKTSDGRNPGDRRHAGRRNSKDREDTGGKLASGSTVIYAAGEGAIGIERKRRPAWRQHRLIPGGSQLRFFSVSAVPLIREVASVEAFIAALRDKRLRPSLIVLDTLSRMLAGMNENDAADASLAIEAIEAIKRAFDCIVLVIHHTGKDEKAERGSSVFRAGFDTLISCKADTHQRLMTLAVTKQKDAEAPNPITLKGHKVLDSLAFSPAKQEEINVGVSESTPDRDALTRRDVGAFLREAGALGLGNAVATKVLAHGFLEIRGELPEEWEQQAHAIRTTERALQKLSKGPLAGYVVSLPNTTLQWALPA